MATFGHIGICRNISFGLYAASWSPQKVTVSSWNGHLWSHFIPSAEKNTRIPGGRVGCGVAPRWAAGTWGPAAIAKSARGRHGQRIYI
eukprot:7351775-Pyramimonas_sp.AAC.2